MDELQYVLDNVVMKTKEYLSRANNLYFEKPSSNNLNNFTLSFQIITHSFSRIDRAVKFEIHLAACTFTLDQRAINEI